MTIAIVLLVGILAAGAGAFGGRWLTLRELGDLDELKDAVAANSKRANTAASRVEKIADQWPFILSRWDQLEPSLVQSLSRAEEVERRSLETQARQAALEQAISANFSVTLEKGA